LPEKGIIAPTYRDHAGKCTRVRIARQRVLGGSLELRIVAGDTSEISLHFANHGWIEIAEGLGQIIGIGNLP